MKRDFIADLLYYIFSEEKKEKTMPKAAKTKLFDKIQAMLNCWTTSNPKHTEGE